MHVGVHEAVEEDHLRDAPQAGQRQLLAALGDLGRLDAVDELHRQHPARAQRLVQIGHADARIAGKVAGDAAVIAGLDLEVELGAQRGGEALDRAGQRDPAHLGEPVEQARAHREDGQVALDLRLGPAALHLHGDLAAVGEYAAVDLRHARRGDGYGVDRREELAGIGRELLREDLLYLVERGRGDVVVQPRQGGRDPRGEHVRARRGDLAQLHEGGPELLERARQDPSAQGVAVAVGASGAGRPREQIGHERPQQHEDDHQGASGDRQRAHHRTGSAILARLPRSSHDRIRPPGRRQGGSARPRSR